MKVVNDLIRPTLITAQEVQKAVGKAGNNDLTRIASNIIVAEERFLVEMLGYELYEHLVATKNTEVNSVNKSDLQTALREAWEDDTLVLNIGDIVNDEATLGAEEKKLWRTYLWQLAAECVIFVAFPDNYTDFTSQGIVHNAPKMDPLGGGGANTPGLNTLKFQMDKMLTGRIGVLVENMHKYICRNKEHFPLYRKACECDYMGKPYNGNGPVFLNIYDEEELEKCCD
jgi:hypothetical protein